ncbi:MAG: hypothetical protein ACREVO_10705 [Steroidobacteraceae bacterium]
MNAIQKATFAASALAITCLGAALVTAPMAFARPVALVAQRDCTTFSPRLSHSGQPGCTGFAAGAELMALNRG